MITFLSDSLDKSFLFLHNLEIDYLWFYGALSQSMAALIGIVGMFIVYRLQVQEYRINDSLRKLQEYLSFPNQNQLFSLSDEETIRSVEDKIESLKRNIENNKNSIKGFERQFNKSQLPLAIFDSKKGVCLNDIIKSRKFIESLEDKKGAFLRNGDYRAIIKWNAFVVILWLIVLFCLSLGGLVLSKSFVQEEFLWSKQFIMIIFITLISGLYLLLRCCMLSLDISLPLITYIKSRKKK